MTPSIAPLRRWLWRMWCQPSVLRYLPLKQLLMKAHDAQRHLQQVQKVIRHFHGMATEAKSFNASALVRHSAHATNKMSSCLDQMPLCLSKLIFAMISIQHDGSTRPNQSSFPPGSITPCCPSSTVPFNQRIRFTMTGCQRHLTSPSPLVRRMVPCPKMIVVAAWRAPTGSSLTHARALMR